jgi:hypothetical protein
VNAVGAYAIVRGEEPKVVIAEDAQVLSRALAVTLVAQLPANQVSTEARLEDMKQALLEERWADALVSWMEETETSVDVYDESLPIWAATELDEEQASLEIRMAPLFSTET